MCFPKKIHAWEALQREITGSFHLKVHFAKLQPKCTFLVSTLVAAKVLHFLSTGIYNFVLAKIDDWDSK